MPQAVIFDVDGTLVDSVDLHARAWQEALHDFGHEVGFEEVRSQIGKGGDQLMPVFLSEAELKEKGSALEKHRSALFKDRYMGKVRGFADVPALFRRLRAEGVKIALASSAKEEELKHYKQVAGIEGLTDEQTSSDDAEKSKPHPDIFQAALKRLGNPDPAEVIVVGDSPYDAQAASKAGMRTIGVLCGGFPEASLREAGCIAIYAGPTDLLAHLDTSPLATGSAPQS